VEELLSNKVVYVAESEKEWWTEQDLKFVATQRVSPASWPLRKCCRVGDGSDALIASLTLGRSVTARKVGTVVVALIRGGQHPSFSAWLVMKGRKPGFRRWGKVCPQKDIPRALSLESGQKESRNPLQGNGLQIGATGF